ncbi:MAG: type IV pilus secretin PilQ [Oryzomonas sp.]|uniref:type IV pilus secretin PilQ n=1 Tax=Oryzomonas sp. TaxID=2855186 RepID=UPI002851D466|nr:type IV pilus secretin PilQ [Oryzomonas sp.]MDR3579680.1 type IV pilus secretin PilQ [Oryzomonas sp.]
MKWFTRQSIVLALVMTVATVFFTVGMASRAESAPESEKAKIAAIESISVSGEGDATELVIRLSSPVAYTNYKTTTPLRLVIDLSQTTQGAITSPLAINRGNFKNVSVSRFDTDAGTLARINVGLINDIDAIISASPDNPAELHIAFPVQHAALPGANTATETAVKTAEVPASTPVSAPAPNPVAATVPVKAEPEPRAASEVGAKRTLSAVTTKDGAIILAIDGGIDDFKTFRLNKPERYVIDLPGVVSVLPSRLIPLNTAGVASARIGLYPDRTRVVLDGINGSFPEATASKTAEGVRIVLEGKSGGETAAKPAAIGTEIKLPAQEAAAPEQKAAASEQKAAASEQKAAASEQKAAAPEQKAAAPEQKVAEPQPPASVSPAAPKVEMRAATGPAIVESIDFQVVDGISRVAVKVSGDAIVGQPVKAAGFVTLTIRNANLPKRLQRSLDAEAFVSPVLRVTPFMVKTRKGTDTKLRIALRAAASYEFRHEGDMYFVDFKATERLGAEKPAMECPEPRLRAAQVPKSAVAKEVDITSELVPASESRATSYETSKMYKGRKVTLEFADADVRKIFQLLSEVSNKNFVLGDDVTGTISIKLVNVPWDQALDIILDTKGLDKREQGNVIIIKGKGKFKSQAEEEQEIKKALTNSTELKTEMFSLNYADIVTISNQFKALKTERGVITQDSRTNKVIVKDIPQALDDMRKLVQQLDVPEKQVMIEARIIEATSTFSQSIGVNWGIHYQDGSASFMGINSLDTNFGGAVTTVPTTSGVGTASGMATGISFGSLTSNIQLDLRLNAAASVGLVKIISAPKVATLNNKTAKISQGQQIPYQNSSANTGPVTQFIEAALALEVTPHINANGTISLKVDAKNDSPGAVPTGATAPAINKKEAVTEMLLQDGETTVIGGIFVDNDSDEDDGVPFLMDIPFIGKFFKDNTKTKTKTELLIFITPRILNSI